MASKKILVLKLGALGDMLMATPAISAICEQHREDETWLFTSSDFVSLFSSWPGLQVKGMARSGFRAACKSIGWIRAQGFDQIYDLQSNDRSRLYCMLSGSGEIVGNHDRWPYTIHPGESYRGQCHISEWHKNVLQAAGVAVGTHSPWLPETAEGKEKVAKWLESQGLAGEQLVLMHAGASPGRPEKRWPYYRELAQKIEAAGARVVWLGSDAELETNRQLSRSAGIDASGLFSISELVELGRHAAFSVTNDSGPMHALSCAGTAVYSLFGPSDWTRNHAIGQQDHVVALNKTNALWQATDFTREQAADLGQISADMLWALLLKEKRIET